MAVTAAQQQAIDDAQRELVGLLPGEDYSDEEYADARAVIAGIIRERPAQAEVTDAELRRRNRQERRPASVSKK